MLKYTNQRMHSKMLTECAKEKDEYISSLKKNYNPFALPR